MCFIHYMYTCLRLKTVFAAFLLKFLTVYLALRVYLVYLFYIHPLCGIATSFALTNQRWPKLFNLFLHLTTKIFDDTELRHSDIDNLFSVGFIRVHKYVSRHKKHTCFSTWFPCNIYAVFWHQIFTCIRRVVVPGFWVFHKF